ncbi:pyridoxamine 5'-phosphate oxidase family protein [Nocardiopsis tropica]|uniref:Pyridoxamine 5'-phosphate oxidase family protein n=1 Tax=Nocardiopsis tropica TaxID=109330 RepID=A0ABU7KSC4_9ACTN|nr:pyridoxamine 5'-phosphate oxidase family protein [Nocardiopsis umidischolae]MEE2052198.1 pyridoxamine 5'-phosphate oxidase family protein [Nocardiopsis umidischolae]
MFAFPDPKAESLTSGPPGVWSEVLPHLVETAGTYWLTVSRAEGPPHTRPLLAVWVDGQPCFASGQDSAKSRLMASSPDVSLAFGTGRMDVVVEGTVEAVLDAERLDRVAAAYAERYGWAPAPGDGELTGPEGAPTAGPPPYRVFTVTPSTVFAFPADELPHGPTRWRFDVWP